MFITTLEYGVLMQALQNAQGQHAEGDFVDYYAENEKQYTDKDFEVALNSIEKKLLDLMLNQQEEVANTPT